MSRAVLACITDELIQRSGSSGSNIPGLLLDSLTALTTAKLNHLATPGPAAQLSLYEKREKEAEYAAQLKFLNALMDQRLDSHGSPDGSASLDHGEERIDVKYPTYLRSLPTRQGPFLLQPAPRELESDEDEPVASDLAYMLVDPDPSDESEEDAFAPPAFLLMSYQNGKIDVCIDVAKVEATWSRQDADAVSHITPASVHSALMLFYLGICPTESPVSPGVRKHRSARLKPYCPVRRPCTVARRSRILGCLVCSA